MNMREDTLAQILAWGNVFSGMRCMVFDQALGIVVGSVAERMGGAGRMLSLYITQDPGHKETIKKFNFDYQTEDTIKYVSGYEIFAPEGKEKVSFLEADIEQAEMIAQGWPVALQPHTEDHLRTMSSDEDRVHFLEKRSARFLRKMTRPSVAETNSWLSEKNDSLIIATKLNPVVVLKKLLPYLKESCPFVVYGEHIQSLVVAFKFLQDNGLAEKLQLR
mgnify:FL=1